MGGIIGRQRGRRNLGQSLAHGSKTLENKVEAADLEDFAYYRLGSGYRNRASLLTDLLGRQHQDAQSNAADVIDLRKIQDQEIAPCSTTCYKRVQSGLQSVGCALV